MPSAPLSTQSRRDALDTMSSEHLDVLIIGGGVVGAGAALDAASRGLKVGLVEAQDLAAGTSSRSSKLIHGGLRYLEMLDFSLVAEALAERGLLAEKLAPHLVRSVPFLYPLRHVGWERLYAGAGVALYDTMATVSGRRGGVPWHRHLTRQGALRRAPALRSNALTGAMVYHDAQVDDARHTMFLARTAASHGALVATRARVESLTKTCDSVVGGSIRDLETGTTLNVLASCVVNATGVWTGTIDTMTSDLPDFTVRASKGVHLVVPRACIDSEVGMIMRTSTSVLFVIPWDEHWIIGTTDTDWAHGLEHPSATSTDIDYLLGQVNRSLRTPLTRADIVGTYAGLRPLLSGTSKYTARLSREHAVSHRRRGLVSMAGGKYTTYRIMARDAIDEAVLDVPSPASVSPSCTEDVPLLGADGYPAVVNRAATIARTHRLEEQVVRRLTGRYGSLIDEVLAPALADPTWSTPLLGAGGYLRAEALYAATHEGALHLEDVMTRRTRISIETPDRGRRASEHVADILAPVLGWTKAQHRAEVDRYGDRVAAELDSQQLPDDFSADRARNRVLPA